MIGVLHFHGDVPEIAKKRYNRMYISNSDEVVKMDIKSGDTFVLKNEGTFIVKDFLVGTTYFWIDLK